MTMDKKVIIIASIAAVIVIAGIIGFVLTNNNGGNNDSGEVTITYHGNGGTLGEETQTTSTSKTIPTMTWKLNGSQPVGYTISADGSGTVYKTGDKVPNVKDLYVKWELVTKMTVNISGLPSDLKVTCGSTTLHNGSNVLEAEGCEFTVTVEGSTPGKYTFVKDPDSWGFSYFVKNTSEQNEYKITYSYESYINQDYTHISPSRGTGNVSLNYNTTMIQSLTLTIDTLIL